MPMPIEDFEKKAEKRAKNDVQGRIINILKANKGEWLTAAQIEDATDIRRQSINQAIRSLVRKDEIEREKRRIDGIKTNYIKIGDDDE
ncbi:MAG: MarR family transcriptional regulator [Petrotogales bacterium]